MLLLSQFLSVLYRCVVGGDEERREGNTSPCIATPYMHINDRVREVNREVSNVFNE